MKLYEVRHFDANYPGRTKILKYKAFVIFKYKRKMLVYLKPLEEESYYFKNPDNPETFLKGYVVCKNDHILMHPYLATSFKDGLKKLFNIKTKIKPINPFA